MYGYIKNTYILHIFIFIYIPSHLVYMTHQLQFDLHQIILKIDVFHLISYQTILSYLSSLYIVINETEEIA